jgi:hypothetical protein
MRRLVVVLALSAASAVAASCGSAQAQVMLPDSQPLSMPAAPSHVVLPAAPEPPPAPVVETPAPVTIAPTTQGNGATRQRQDPPASRPVAPPSPPPAAQQPPAPATPTPLEAAPNQSELEQRARGLVQSAERAMDKLDYKALGDAGQKQFDTAKRFLKQADDALKAKNIVYAWQLADKANTIATLLK